MTKHIDDALGLRSSVPAIIDNDEEKLPAITQQASDDVDFAREGLYDAFVKAQTAVEDMLSIAQQSQHPKAYEVLNSAVKTLADVSMGIADLQIKKQKLVGRKEEPKTVNNNLFVGSTEELLKALNNNGSSKNE